MNKLNVIFILVFICIVSAGIACMWYVARPSKEPEEAVAPIVETIQAEALMDAGSVQVSDADADGESSTVPAESEEEPLDAPVTFTFGGDLLFDPHYAVMSKLKQRGGGIESALSPELLSILRESDVAVLNNEFPYSNRGFPTPEKTYTFRADPASAHYLLDMGVDLVTLANNHAYDYGEEAIIDTFSTLSDYGITFIGAGMNKEEAAASARYEITGERISVLSATQIERLSNPDTREATDTSPGVFRCLDNKRLLSRIREEKDAGYFVIVCIHWGTENEEEIDWLQIKQGPEMVEAGADLIIGCHPHILQGVDVINGVPVFYSTGNFLFNSKPLDNCVVQAVIKDGKLRETRFIPCLQRDCHTSVAEGEEKARIISHVNEMSGKAILDSDGIVQQ